MACNGLLRGISLKLCQRCGHKCNGIHHLTRTLSSSHKDPFSFSRQSGHCPISQSGRYLTSIQFKIPADTRRQITAQRLTTIRRHVHRPFSDFYSHVYMSKNLLSLNAISKYVIVDDFYNVSATPIFQLRCNLHTNVRSLKDDSKVEQSIKALKEQISKPEKKEDDVPTKVKPPLWRRFWDELLHYYHGFRLLLIDIKVAIQIIWSLRDGHTMTRRERKQLIRTVADLFRLVPFLVFILVPFMELLIPVAVKLFPNMLPSTFETADKKQEKIKKKLKTKLEMAKFLQDTIEQSSLQRSGRKEGDLASDFSQFLSKIRQTGELATADEIKKYSKLFEDEMTLDNLSRAQLRALCSVLDLRSLGPDYFLRYQLRMHLRTLMADDKMIQKEGIDSLSTAELQSACRARGMRSLGLPTERLQSQMTEWIHLHLESEVPASLLLLSRAFYISDAMSTPDQLQATLSFLPEAMTEEAKIKAAELSGEKVDNLAKLQRIKDEQAAIEKESLEKAQQEELEGLELEKAERIETAADLKLEKDIITHEDLERIEAAIETVCEDKDLSINLRDLKEEISEHHDDIQELKEVVVAGGGSEQDLRETKGAKRLKKKVSQLIDKMDGSIEALHRRKQSLQEEIEVTEVRIKHSEEPQRREKMISERDTHKKNLISTNDLLMSLKRLKKVPDSDKLQKILEVLDEDKDGAINVNHVLKVIELLAKENVKLDSKQVSDMIELMKQEELLEKNEKKKQQEESQRQKVLLEEEEKKKQQETLTD